MADDKYLLRPPPEPEKIANRPHPFTFWVSVAAALFAGLAAAFSWWQAFEARQARLEAKEYLDKQMEDIRKAREATERSAKAAEEAVVIGRQALQIGERPWLYCRTTQLSTPLAVGQDIKAFSVLVNAGKSPAYEVKANQWVQVHIGQVKSLAATNRLTTPPSTSMVGPGGDVTIRNEGLGGGRLLTVRDLDHINTGKFTLYVFGTATYFDRLSNEPRYVQWCSFYAPKVGDPAVNLLKCPFHNSSN